MTDRDKGNLERAGSSAGGLAGRAADTAVDLMGSVIGTAARMFGGWWSDRSPDEAVRSFGEQQDTACRTHFQNSKSSTSSYDAVRPLYQFGHLAGSNPDYQGRSFEEVEGDLQNAWTGDAAQKYGDWASVRDYVSTGYKSRS